MPDIADHFTGKAKNLLTDRNHGVLLSAITLVTEMCTVDPAILEEFRSVRATCRMPCNDLILSFALGCSASSSESEVTRHHRLQPRTRRLRNYGSFPAGENLAAAPPAWERRRAS